jgi:hypothetical protein
MPILPPSRRCKDEPRQVFSIPPPSISPIASWDSYTDHSIDEEQVDRGSRCTDPLDFATPVTKKVNPLCCFQQTETGHRTTGV